MDGQVTMIRLSNHAYKQYCDRVKQETYLDLTESLNSATDVEWSAKPFIRIGDVWWIYEQHEGTTTLITCYGNHPYLDVPKAIKWARRHNDGINLTEVW